jgi:hypothetical protein
MASTADLLKLSSCSVGPKITISSKYRPASIVQQDGPEQHCSQFRSLNQLVNPSSPCDKEKRYNKLDALSLKRSCDLLNVEPLPFSLVSASDGVRLEKGDTGSSQFTAVALNGLVEASKLVSHKDVCYPTIGIRLFTNKSNSLIFPFLLDPCN